nr:MAG TPA: hypothetical protein [Caudoviricetes sp.]
MLKSKTISLSFKLFIFSLPFPLVQFLELKI